MKASTERKIMRWLHLVLCVPIIGFIYGPVADIPRAAFATRWVFVPVVVLSGLWMWKGQWLRRYFNTKPAATTTGRFISKR